jgi:hypothetical protein
MRFMMVAALATVAAVTVEAAPQRSAIRQLAWLQGCWETTSAGRTSPRAPAHAPHPPLARRPGTGYLF